jgi:hypothetical protein
MKFKVNVDFDFDIPEEEESELLEMLALYDGAEDFKADLIHGLYRTFELAEGSELEIKVNSLTLDGEDIG